VVALVEYEISFGRRTVSIAFDPEKKTATVGDKSYQIQTTKYGNRILVDLDGKTHSIEIIQGRVYVNGEEQRFTIGKGKPRFLGGKKADAAAKGARVKPPMPGRIVSIDVKVGDQVKRGQGLLVLEAMKMQNEITAPADGLVKAVNVKPGQTVDNNAVLVEIE
jgi:biotin carboxyl carrier protein